MLGQLDVADDEATLTAHTLVEASLRGVDSHGVTLLAVFAERIRSEQIHPGRVPFVRREGPCTAWMDGQHGLGPPLADGSHGAGGAQGGAHRPGGGVAAGRQLRGGTGTLLPVGGALGYGLGLMVDVLTGVAGGGTHGGTCRR